MRLLMSTRSTDLATTGSLLAAMFQFATIELPWRDNRPDVSCVPAGDYDLIPYQSPEHGATWCLRNPVLAIMGAELLTSAQIAVGMRNYCELHNGNFARQSDGCILVGLTGQPMLDDATGFVVPAVKSSDAAFERLRELLVPGTAGHRLTITREFS